MNSLFLLDPDVTFLNHGSFGATPRPVLDVYHDWQREMEREPVDFYGRRAQSLLHEAKLPLAEFLNTTSDRLAWVQNATSGMNVAAWSLKLGPGDEVVLNDHEYGAVSRTFLYLSRRFGFTVKIALLPTPLSDPQQITDAVVAQMTPATRLIVMSHITSATALVFPVERIVAEAKRRGIATLIDGAHVPGHLDLNLNELGADFYVGNLHKWLSAPKAAAFLYVDPAYQSRVEPLLVGWAYEPQHEMLEPSWIAITETLGTRDLAAFLSVPAALKFHREHHGSEVRTACRQQIQRWLDGFAEGNNFRCPLQMGAVLLPEGTDGFQLHRWLWEVHRFEVPVQRIEDRYYLRACFQSYNRPQQLDRLSELVFSYKGTVSSR